MKKLVHLTASILVLSCVNANANTLANLLDDIKNDMIIVEKTGSCDRNPNLKNADGVSHSIKPCKSVVAQCPQGTTIIPGLSKCKMTASAQDTEILSILKKIKGDSVTNVSNPDGYSKIIAAKTLMNNNTQQCEVDGDGWEWTTDDIGYTSFCFFDLSKVETIDWNYKYSVIGKIDGGLVEMQNKPYVYYPNTNNYSKITLSESNNSGNYKCYAVNIKATARCLPTPDGFVKKLGLEVEKF